MYRTNLINLAISYTGLFLGLFNTFIKPKVFTSEEIGIFSTIVSMTLILKLITESGLSSVIMRYYPVYKNRASKCRFVLSVTVISYAILGFFILLLFLSKGLLSSYYGNSSIEDYFFLLPSFLFLSHGLDITERFSKVLFVSVKSNIIRNIYFKAANGAFLFYMLFSHITLKSYFVFFIIINTITFLMMLKLIIPALKIKPVLSDLIPDLSLLKNFKTYAFFMMISAFSATMVSNIDRIMIGHYLDFSKTGIYTISAALAGTLIIIFNSFARTAQPKLSELVQYERFDDVKNIYRENLYDNLHFGIALFVVLAVFSHDILHIFGTEYKEGVPVIVLLAFGQLLNISSGMCGEIISLSGFYKFDFYSRIGLIIVVVISNSVFIPEYGITGAAIATAFNILIYSGLKIYYAFSKFGIHPFTARSASFYIAGSFAAVLMTYAKPLAENNITGIFVVSAAGFFIYDVILGTVLKYKNSVIIRIIRKTGR